jgi:hypothetical protein
VSPDKLSNLFTAIPPQFASKSITTATGQRKDIYSLTSAPLVVLAGPICWIPNAEHKVPSIGIRITPEIAEALKTAVDEHLAPLFPGASTSPTKKGASFARGFRTQVATAPFQVFLPIKTAQDGEGCVATIQLPYDITWAKYYEICDEDSARKITANEIKAGYECEVEVELSPFIFQKEGEEKKGFNLTLKQIVQEPRELPPKEIEMTLGGRKLQLIE